MSRQRGGTVSIVCGVFASTVSLARWIEAVGFPTWHCSTGRMQLESYLLMGWLLAFAVAVIGLGYALFSKPRRALGLLLNLATLLLFLAVYARAVHLPWPPCLRT